MQRTPQSARFQYTRPPRSAHRKIVEFREVTPADVPSLFYVRTRSRENGYTLEELAGLGITEKTVIEKLSSSFKGWLCQFDDLVVGFCIADRGTGELWVIAVLPDFECKGIGSRLMAWRRNGFGHLAVIGLGLRRMWTRC